ncbi:UDP-N-acetylenolpyruvoylglucosamine reductase [Syntrophotalea acetylenivorans]|uniref:UDP-N-acetylenolpyruvoylglucosamine reductase n=1 Tax=Syntrophotalea acetylenivorans TaxID=1842532 RepID=A0A1L3GSH9_9BACT|nr:UDP-N-acetylmuramate dehydrogenase [Syntrophotalea acetylenivorans]APG28879.1 UDP-N-acetylenolpyruvoylglucosamine reductase [Syntrophotalea acetylenivorans]
MSESIVKELRAALRGDVLTSEPMSRHTTWRIGGPADLFVQPQDRDDLLTALKILQQAQLPWQVIGNGSNMLVGDGGIRGAVIHMGRLDRYDFSAAPLVTAEGGLRLMTLVREACKSGLGGLEQLAGIPGTLGGSVAMNAGAGQQDLGRLVRTVVLAGADGEEQWTAEQLRFAYRSTNLPAGRVVVAVQLKLVSAEAESLQEEVKQRLLQRRRSQGVGRPNAGSVFKNPPGEQAWKLIDRAGMRGAVVGGARVSERHSNFIVNGGSARAADVLTLMEQIQDRVYRQSGINLEPEVRIVGEL